jgi:hypothetical protein
MINETSTNRIIGDFLELNASMIEKREKSKLPKFIARYIWKRDVKKLLNEVENLRNSGYIMNIGNISELMIYIFNNFDDKSYKSIKKIKTIDAITYSTMEMVMKFDNITAIFDYDNKSDTFELKILTKDELDQKITYEYTLHRMVKEKTNEVLYKINEELRNIYCDYIVEIISAFE